MKEKDTQVKELHRVPNKRTPTRPKPKHIIIKMPKVKQKKKEEEEELKAAGESLISIIKLP